MIPADDQFDAKLEKEALMQAIFTLPPEVKEVFLLFYYQGFTTQEIADMLNVQPGTISSRLSRGRKKLKALLEEDDIQDEA